MHHSSFISQLSEWVQYVITEIGFKEFTIFLSEWGSVYEYYVNIRCYHMGTTTIAKDTILCSLFLEMRNEVTTVLFLLETSKRHLCPGNVLFRVFQILEKSIFVPNDAFADVGGGI